MNLLPKVSVCIVTYNQQDYIGDCLLSILNQVTNFDFEIIVGDDCSTDNTKKIINEFIALYPRKIRAVFHKKNVGPALNYFSIHKLALGDYICHLDGDDYALPGKLQAQSDFLDRTTECNICFHRVKVLLPNGQLKDDLIEYDKIRTGFLRSDLIRIGAVAVHSSKMYRKSLFNSLELLDERKDVMDFVIEIVQVGEKKAMYLSEDFFGVYRLGTGITKSSNLEKMKKNNFLYLYELFPELSSSINVMVIISALACLRNMNKYFFLYLFMFLNNFRFNTFFRILKILKIIRMFRSPKFK